MSARVQASAHGLSHDNCHGQCRLRSAVHHHECKSCRRLAFPRCTASQWFIRLFGNILGSILHKLFFVFSVGVLDYCSTTGTLMSYRGLYLFDDFRIGSHRSSFPISRLVDPATPIWNVYAAFLTPSQRSPAHSKLHVLCGAMETGEWRMENGE